MPIPASTLTRALSRIPATAATVAALLSACSAPSSVEAWRSAREYTLPQSVMGALPCVSEAATRAFGTTPRRGSDTAEAQNDLNPRGSLGAPQELEFRPADAASPEERVLFGFWAVRPDTTQVRIAVLPNGPRRTALEALAQDVLAQCGGWPK